MSGNARNSPVLGKICAAQNANGASKEKYYNKAMNEVLSGGGSISKPYTVLHKVTSHCGSVLMCLILAPRGTSIVWALVPKKLLPGRWLVLTTDTPCPGAVLPPWATLSKPPLMPSWRPIAISSQSLERDHVHQVSWLGIHRPYQSLCRGPRLQLRPPCSILTQEK